MQIIVQAFLCLIYLVVAVNCQGGGGGGGAGGAAGVFCVIFFPICLCWWCCAGKPRRSNAKFVMRGKKNTEETGIMDYKFFQSGVWESQYFQHDQWHGPFQLQLTFDVGQSKVTGSGSDDVGVYTIDGIYSTHTGRIGLTKTYQIGTGNPLENLGHTVTIQLEWNRNTNQFEGKWYVRTKKFIGSNTFTLKSNQQQQQQQPPSYSSIYEKV